MTEAREGGIAGRAASGKGAALRIEDEEAEAYRILGGTLEAGLILLCDHACNALPSEFGDLGLSRADLDRHIGYDIGTEVMTRILAARFEAPALFTRFSRLLIDPNRGPDDPTLVMRISDGALVPGNAAIDAAGIEARRIRYHQPYHAAIERTLDTVLAAGVVPVIVSIHSFTPMMKRRQRPWHVGILWDNDPRLSVALIERLRGENDLVIGDNEPYDGALAGDTLEIHATRRGLANTLIEVRNDLISTEADAISWGERLAGILAPLLRAPGLDQILKVGSRSALRTRRAAIARSNTR